MDITNLKAWQLKEKIANKELKVSEITEAFINRSKDIDKDINSFTSHDYEGALAKAKSLDEKEPSGKLFGLPIGIKDNISVKGMKNTCASKILENYEAVFDANCIEHINEENGIIIGKLNMDQFAMGGSNETSYFGPVHNPLDLKRVPGGSSGGSAAAVSSRQVPLSLGTDTGGSVRQPASYCACVGFKPSYGTVSRNGVVSLSNTLDQVSTFANDVKDVALITSAIAHKDHRDLTSLSNPIDEITYTYDDAIKYLKTLKVGVPKEVLADEKDDEVEKAYRDSIDLLKNNGVEIVEIDLKDLKYAVATYYIIMNAEASSNLSRFDGVKYGLRDFDAESLEEMYIKTRAEGFGPEVKRRILFGTYILSQDKDRDYFQNALKARTLLINDFKQAFKMVDTILVPTSPIMPFEIGTNINDPIKMYNADKYTVPVNIAGNCAISVPSTKEHILNSGMEFICDNLEDNKLLKIAYAYEGLVK
ncbi:Asp-tRNA(Asn)/Glu-tRNA(Gln) amidotransferase subunit GatA [Fenollaria massiliensis]|uniref:Glutamyl-tRNA(Gln) amidotransferase subunit A n=1 Tax=Fenollaria massiliensis TaxID=938288 RepID=A0A9E7DIA0_9FIRM|nr:Asp-tRNA(Asn)/Glu-tRNA(Gln) amidotransferase subunit GatA [Fenollaria massiliensis]UQK58638.1 Asp-tRNA(Asn)/Glu-tRNA(Gln) amidotransferase subunit GatA [Fenollaria massiliensis]